MNKTLLVILMLIIFQSTLQAQESDKKNNITGAGVGFLSNPDFVIIADKFFTDVIDEPDNEKEAYTLPLSFFYDRMIGDHFSLGAVYVYQHYKTEKDWNTVRYENSVERWQTIMPRIKAYWGDNDSHIYHGLALGYTLYTDHTEYSDKPDKNTRDYDIAFQLTVIGFDISIGNAYFYTDLGVGMQGMWTFGTGLTF